MAAVTSALKSGAKALAEPLVSVGLKAVLDLPAGGLVAWVKSRFHDHSAALLQAIAAANARAWQAVGLALAGDSLLGRITGLFRDGDLKAVQAQIRAFVADADTGLDGQSAGLRARACDELNRLQRAGRLSAETVQLESVDLNRFASTATVADDAHRAIRHIADDLAAECPHLAQVLILSPPGGGTPLLAAAFAYFFRRQIATNAELARELTHDQLRLLSQKQQAGFANLESSLGDKWDSLEATLGGWFATTDATLDEVRADLKKLLDANQVATKPESPLRVSVTSAEELERLKKVRDRLRGLPTELIDAKLFASLGDGEAAAGEFAHAQAAHGAAATAAHESADAAGEADAAYKQFKDACELMAWDAALAALNRAVALDEKRFRPVPKHYTADGILGAGAFGVVLKCRDRTETDDDGNHVVVAVKTFRASDLDRPLEDIFAEASLLKKLTHPNVIGIHERGFADPDAQQRPFLAMEFFPGVTLEDHLDTHGKLSLADFLAVFGGIAAALHAAHTARRPVIHRDVKPANVMMLRANGAWAVKVIDFGLAVKSAMRQASREVSRHVPQAKRSTHDRSVTGTFKYAAPEQLGEKAYSVGPHSDVYAFGKTALEALLGTVQPTPKHWRQLPESLSDLLERCVDEDYDPATPNEGRFHGFGPILPALTSTLAKPDGSPPLLAPKSAPEPTEEVLDLTPEPPMVKPPVVARRVEPTPPITADPVTEFAEWKAQVAEVAARAERAADVFDYARAVALYAGVPTKRRDEAKLTQWAAKRDQLAKLDADLTGWQEMSEDELGSVLDRMLSLHPDHPRAKPWRAKVETTEDRQVQAGVARLRQALLARQARLEAGDRHEITLPSGVKMTFAWCPAGTFLMGSPASEKDRGSDEQQHEVRLTRGFFVGVHPVTREQFAAFVDATKSKTEAETSGGGYKWSGSEWEMDAACTWRMPGFAQADDHPVVVVSHNDAVAYAKWVSSVSGQSIRLLTEAEWEYAARGGTATPFYWGHQLNGTQANCDGSNENYPYLTSTKGGYREMTTAVGSYADMSPHPWGLADVIGNVWEWCGDWYDEGYYAKPPKEDPTGPESGSRRVRRGGSWLSRARICRAAFRSSNSPDYRNYLLGFRLAAGPSGE